MSNMSNMDNKNNAAMTLEQRIVKHLADKGYITSVGDVTRALKDILYADVMITGNIVPGLKDDIKDEIASGNIDGVVGGECDHTALTNDEIQEVFDNDNESEKL
jgi:predicted transcriptional regulator